MNASYSKLYEVIFDINFLVKYGYYDIQYKPKPSNSANPDVDETYGNTDSFYINIFNMDSFTKYLKNSNIINSFPDKPGGYTETEPVYFSIPKSSVSRRQYKMPNLYSFLALDKFIVNNKKEFIDVFERNGFSTSKFFNMLNFTFKSTNQIKKRLLHGGDKILHTDLSSFYHTLYTHSIPWIILGKNNAKRNKHNGFANDLDYYIRLCQYNETHGIPTGNLLSRIVAELYMCYFDQRMGNKNLIYARYVDDISFSFHFDSEKTEFLSEFNSLCREYALISNEKKIKVDEFPYNDANNKERIFGYFDLFDGSTSANKWIDKISEFITFCISQDSIGNKGSIKLIFTSMQYNFRNKKVSEKVVSQIFSTTNGVTGYNLFEEIIDLSLKDSRLTNRFLSFLEEIHKLGFKNSSAKRIVRRYFRKNKDKLLTKVKHYQEDQFNQELYQILLYIVVFNVDKFLNKNELLSIIDKDVDDYSLVLATIIYIKSGYSKTDLLRRIDGLLKEIYSYYDNNVGIMSEKLWFFKYFYYYLCKVSVFPKALINEYCNKHKVDHDKRGEYKSELNWKYIGKQGGGKYTKVNDFYNELLDNDVWLVNCGTDNNFLYLTDD